MNSFNATSLSDAYRFIDDCPEHLLDAVIALPVQDSLQARVEGVLGWRTALLAGELPQEGHWPRAPLDTPARKALQELGLLRFCRDQPEIVDELLLDILDAIARQQKSLEEHVWRGLRELEELLRERDGEDRILEEDKRRAAIELATDDFAGLEHAADGQLVGAWAGHVRMWSEMEGVFGDLGALLGRGRDFARGVLRQTGWLEAVRLSELMATLPELREVVRALGRLQHRDDGPSVTETIIEPMSRIEEYIEEQRTPHVPEETRGVERGGDIARMLPAEAVLLRHPTLRYLWHARRAEHALAVYRVEGTEFILHQREVDDVIQRKLEKPRPDKGPIIAVVDTSGSMHGLPEQVAKALVLEALRTAHAEGRRCLVFAFSGPGDVSELEVDVSDDGIATLLEFLGWSFHGGTDITQVMQRVLSRLNSEEWERADVLIATDGEWSAGQSVVTGVETQRESGTRFHGVQIGNRGHTGLHAVCDEIHEFSDWSTLITY